jgi:hypothetical protein
MRLAVMVAPVAAAAGVAALSLQVTNPSNALSPTAQIATEADWAAHEKHASSTFVPVKGSTASNTSFDCQASFSGATLHRIPWRGEKAALP